MDLIHSLVSALIAFAGAHRLLAYGLALLLAAAEALPVAGALVPGTAVIVGLGALVPGGALVMWPLIGFTALGALTGDGLSYLFGRHYKQRAMGLWPLRARPGLLAAGEAFFARHGSKAVLISRFLPGVRAAIPMVAGMAGMSAVRFYLVDICAAALFALAHIWFGMAIGASLTILHAIAGRLVVLALLLAGALGLVAWLTPRIIRQSIALLARLRGPVRQWAAAGDGWARRLLGSALDPERPETLGLLVLAAALIGGVWMFFGVLQDVVAGDPLVRADAAIFHFLQSLRTPGIDQVMVAITELGDAATVIPVLVVAVTWLAWRRAWRAAFYGIAAVAGASLFAFLMKISLQHARPASGFTGWDAYSFPSGHATASTALYGFLVVLICRETGNRARVLVTLAATLLVGAIAFSRLYLGAHWLSDVTAGLAFGVAWVALLGIVYMQHARRDVRAFGLTASGLGALVVAGGLHIATAHARDMQRYALALPVRQMTLADWRGGGWASLPARRVDLTGDYEEPFVLQWAGPLAPLQAALLAQGWRMPVPWDVSSAVEWLLPDAKPDALPVLPHLDNGRAEALVMIKTGGTVPQGQRLILRVWPSGTVLSHAGQTQPLWIGTVVAEKVAHLKPFASLVDERDDVNSAMQTLRAALPGIKPENRAPAGAEWNGEVLLGPS
ncbi:bifunctional DedA family/phosphatase PAP2 family protein [Acidocella sp. KAb 2-4]|uniref:bifunctional DedA family/phosphatase PAP2 family protein n=1 Tax=Acidocella sp. KAb 2-4 TaxID=2885158 RepID=UPI001D06E58A|nr:bifunctional DedA family/phosphatase PAP2 family protein [Acidocella sp. KAb 2-4]MCB5944365.1 phosphatase PAP2 family protein [Acidocella sp. KAb 2-4]